MLASSGDRMLPWGVPVIVRCRLPSSARTPALRNAFTSRRTRLSLMRFRTRPIRAVWSISSKHASMSPSNTHSQLRVGDPR